MSNICFDKYSYNYFAQYRGNFILGAMENKQYLYPLSPNAYLYEVDGRPVYYYKFLWLDYMKKINFVNRLYASGADAWFITNRYEYLGILDSRAYQARAAVFLYSRRGQFSFKYSHTALALEKKMGYMGVCNTRDFLQFHNSPDKMFFTINNERSDSTYLKELASKGFLTISSANSDSTRINTNFYGLHGNNRPIRSMYYFLGIFVKCAMSTTGEIDKYPVKTPFTHTTMKFYQPRSAVNYFKIASGLRKWDRPWAVKAQHIALGDSADICKYDMVNERFELLKTFNYITSLRAQKGLAPEDKKKNVLDANYWYY